MRALAHVFDGYLPGDSDFSSRYEALDDGARERFDAVLGHVARALLSDAAGGPYATVTVVGHSDRQDLPGMTHPQALASEAEAAAKRAEDAWSWLSARITEEAGVVDDAWTEDSTRVTWATVHAGAGQLAVPDPVGEDDRLRNRRVVVLVSLFAAV